MIDTSAEGRTLILLRHAKSAWPDGVPDHDRPLAERGLQAAPVMGRWLRDHGLLPDQVVCSTSRRTRETWRLVHEQLNADPPVVFEGRVYAATPTELLEVVRSVEPSRRTALVIGHDPATSELALTLPAADQADPAVLERIGEKFPTCAVAVLQVSGSWDSLRPGSARLVTFITPRELITAQG